jgi:integrase
MGRTTVYNSNLTQAWPSVSKQNRQLVKEFIDYCKANDRSAQTIKQYEAQLKVFFCWNYNENDDKFFIDLKKRDFVRYLGYLRGLGLSSNRVASLKSAISSLANCIEVLDEDLYPNFRNLIKSLEPVHKTPVREKTVLTDEQVEECLNKLLEQNQCQIACALALSLASGMRKAELTRMKVEFFDEKHLVFDDKMYKTGIIKTKGHGSSGKQIPKYVLRDKFQPYFDAWMKQRAERGIESPWLFVTAGEGKFIQATVSQMNTYAEKIGALMGVPFYFHCMRHLWTSNMQRAGFPDSVIAEIQSWESLEMVKRYSDIPTEERLAQFFNGEDKE